jgi:hypothetical protein
VLVLIFYLDNATLFPHSDTYFMNAAVAELADARDLKSLDWQRSYRFDPGQRHHDINIGFLSMHHAETQAGLC